jgi:hypothetical protein
MNKDEARLVEGFLRQDEMNDLITSEADPITSDLGSPRVVTSSSAGVVSRHDYMLFGEELGSGIGGRTTGMGYSGTSDAIRQKFTGYERDIESGLDFADARFRSEDSH